MSQDEQRKCERFFACGNYILGNGWGMNHNHCSLTCKRKDDDWL